MRQMAGSVFCDSCGWPSPTRKGIGRLDEVGLEATAAVGVYDSKESEGYSDVTMFWLVMLPVRWFLLSRFAKFEISATHAKPVKPARVPFCVWVLPPDEDAWIRSEIVHWTCGMW